MSKGLEAGTLAASLNPQQSFSNHLVITWASQAHPDQLDLNL